MKKLFFLLTCMLSFAAFAKNVPLTINWKFINIVEGYDHTNKIKVYVDDVYKGESGSFSQSETGDFTIKVSKGMHIVRIVNFSLYEGNWEEHTITNNYSIDAVVSEQLDIQEASIFSITWNLDETGPSSRVFETGKPVKTKKSKGKTTTLTILWKHTGVLEGYDHENRINVYANNKLVGTSKEVRQTKEGKFVVKLPAGKYDIRIEDFAFYEGKWEAQTRKNDYSLDAFLNEKIDLSQPKIITILFDIDKEETTYVVQ